MIIGIIFVFLFMFLEISLIMTAIISQDWRYGFVALFMITLVIATIIEGLDNRK